MDLYDELKEAYGQHFQDKFTELMKKKYGIKYNSTSTNGKNGDRGVDGVLNSHIAFAVYAPEVYTEQKALQKIKNDFETFMKNKNNGAWGCIDQYIFVIKRERLGVTPDVLNEVISNFNTTSNVKFDIITMQDISNLCEDFLVFSDDGQLLNKFKNEVIPIMEYIIDTDFTAELFRLGLCDEIEAATNKWRKVRYSFHNRALEHLKLQIMENLEELSMYLLPPYVRYNENSGMLIFANSSREEGERFQNDMKPNVRRLRKSIYELLNQLKIYLGLSD